MGVYLDQCSDRFLQAASHWESPIDKLHDNLTDLAIRPIVGVPSGIAKAMIGIAQIIAGLSISIFFLFASFFAGDPKKAMDCSVKGYHQAFAGSIHVTIGLLEAIPLIGVRVAAHVRASQDAGASLEARAAPLSNDSGKGLVVRNHNLQSLVIPGGGFQIGLKVPIHGCYNVHIDSVRNGVKSTVCFSDSDTMKQAIQDEVCRAIQAIPGVLAPKIAEFSQDFSQSVADIYLDLPEGENTPLCFFADGGVNGGYVYEINGSLTRFPSIDPQKKIRLELTSLISVAFF